MIMKHAALALAVLGTVSACGPQTPEEARAASVAKCERQFGRMAPDAEKGAALCGCMVDRLADEGLEITDALGGQRDRIIGITKSCARANGISTAG